MNSYIQGLTNPILSKYVHVLVLYIICLLAYFHIKKCVHVDYAKNILLAFLVNTNCFGS